jgi:beta-D-xylosidase 4
VQISQQDLVEYYLPSFESCVRSNVGAFMCTYNALNGVPTCADPWLLGTVLREHWGFNESSWVTSDCDSIQNVYLPHQWSDTREGAAADSLVAGTDLDCGVFMQSHLPNAFAQNMLNESALDLALTRQYASLISVGWFDAAEGQPYRQIGWNAVGTNASQQLARRAATEGIVLLKNDGTLPLTIDSSMSVGLFGDWANATEQLLGNYAGIPEYIHSPLYALQSRNVTVNYAGGRPGGQGDPTTQRWLSLKPAIDASDVLIYVGGIDNSVESEGKDRTSLQWTGAQLDVIGQLADTGKPTIVVTMGGGQIDSSPIANNPNISALLWAGYPGQDGGSAVVDILTGVSAPAGRLPTTQYPSSFIAEVPMTDMALRPGLNNPGRTYKWYNGTAVFEFGYGMHYTNFSASIGAGMQQSYAISDLTSKCSASTLDTCPFASVKVEVKNTGHTTSDYVALGYMAGKYGPAPHPKKTLVAYRRLFGIAGGSSDTATLNLTLASLARVDEMGNKVLYPGDYSLLIDNGPMAMVNFTLTGSQSTLETWPQPPANRTKSKSGYYVGGYGSEQIMQ